jgi:hypothetical protein
LPICKKSFKISGKEDFTMGFTGFFGVLVLIASWLYIHWFATVVTIAVFVTGLREHTQLPWLGALLFGLLADQIHKKVVRLLSR